MWFIESSPDGLNLVAKNVPHTETAIELLLDGHGHGTGLRKVVVSNRMKDVSALSSTKKRTNKSYW